MPMGDCPKTNSAQTFDPRRLADAIDIYDVVGLCLCIHRQRNLVGDGGAEHCHVPVLMLLQSCLHLVVDLQMVAQRCFQLALLECTSG